MKKLKELRISSAPWMVSPNDDTMVTTKDGYRVAVGCCERYDGGVGNARLIAAAPELYEALREAVIEVCHEFSCCDNRSEHKCLTKDGECFIQRWRKVLAKAAGEEVAK